MQLKTVLKFQEKGWILKCKTKAFQNQETLPYKKSLQNVHYLIHQIFHRINQNHK